MKTFKVLFCTLLFVLMLVVSAIGCNTQEVTDKEDSLPETEITITHIGAEGTPQGDIIKHGIKDFMDLYPNIKITNDFIENLTYQETIHASIAANSLSEIHWTWQGAFSQHFLDANKVVFLDDYLGHLEEILVDGALYRNDDGSIYGMAKRTNAQILMINDTIFNDLGLNIPTTWDELLNTIEILNENNIIPIALNNDNGFPLHVLFDIIQYRIGGPDLVYDVFFGDGSVTFEHESYVDAARKVQELVDIGAFPENADVMTWDENFALFANGQAAMTYTGQYAYGSILANLNNGKEEFLKNISVVNFPSIYEDGYNNVEQIYFSDGMLITTQATGDKLEAAVKFLEYLTSQEHQKLAVEYGDLPIRAISFDGIEICPLVEEFAIFATQQGTINRNIQQNIAPSTAFYDIFRSQISNAILTKTLTPEEAMKRLNTLWQDQIRD